MVNRISATGDGPSNRHRQCCCHPENTSGATMPIDAFNARRQRRKYYLMQGKTEGRVEALRRIFGG